MEREIARVVEGQGEQVGLLMDALQARGTFRQRCGDYTLIMSKAAYQASSTQNAQHKPDCRYLATMFHDLILDLRTKLQQQTTTQCKLLYDCNFNLVVTSPQATSAVVQVFANYT
jgi:hypothetical protein